MEDFESSNGGWTINGVQPDWAWGTPQKAIINTAASGQKCWITGGLTGNSYNGGEASWLQSPCFDFSTLRYPYIRFKVFWETERQFDGANFQLSTDNGVSWANVGAFSNTPDCLNANWFNTGSVNFLSAFGPSRDGWSGSIQSTSGNCQGGGGSGQWVTAGQTIPYLAGRPSVIFRFTFAAGTQCNNYDGFAVDSILITEAPLNSASFNYSCGSVANSIQFQNTSTLCPTIFNWDFGDLSSGANNLSDVANPTHTFSAPGNYQVSLTVSSYGTQPASITSSVNIIGGTIAVSNPISCTGGNNGALTVSSVAGGSGPFGYVWNTTPQQTGATATNLSSGNYSVTISGVNACAGTVNFNLQEPPILSHTKTVLQPGCGATTGSINITPTGGTPPYAYSWLPAVSTNGIANNLTPGIYTVTVRDSRNCTMVIPITIATAVPPSITIGAVKPVSCYGGNDGAAAVSIVSGSVAPFTYSWNTVPPQTTANATALPPGNHTVIVTDANGCATPATVFISAPSSSLSVLPPTVVASTCELANGSIQLSVSGGTAPYVYTWTPNVSTNDVANNLTAGNYQVVVTDKNACGLTIPTIALTNVGIAPKPFLGRDTTVCGVTNYTLQPGNFDTYLWQDLSTNATFTATQSGTYYVKVSNANICSVTDTIQLVIENDCGEVYFPNVFTPDGDGKNDKFGAIGNIAGISNYSLTVFNRYGQIIFATNNPLQKWEGTFLGAKQAMGTYVYTTKYRYRNRANRSLWGTIVLLR
ncbi:MAG: gliding motility-associated C-terminal domain-containing protein [Ferruginibacter sp.]